MSTGWSAGWVSWWSMLTLRLGLCGGSEHSQAEHSLVTIREQENEQHSSAFDFFKCLNLVCDSL